MQDVKNVCCTPDGKWKALILLVPLRLGADKLNPVYAPCLTSLLTLDTCIGVIGGRPRHSLYFIGYQDDKLIHLDPHYCQVAFDLFQSKQTLYEHCTCHLSLYFILYYFIFSIFFFDLQAYVYFLIYILSFRVAFIYFATNFSKKEILSQN